MWVYINVRYANRAMKKNALQSQKRCLSDDRLMKGMTVYMYNRGMQSTSLMQGLITMIRGE